MNQLNAIGNIGKDAEMRYTSGDNPTAVCQFSFALTSGYGEKAITTWINCSVFGKRGETLAPMLTKGSRVGITGELTNRPYTTKDGKEGYSLELRVSDVTLLGSKDAQPAKDNAPKAKESAPSNDFESEIPF